jgi:hypothetical protein
VLKLPQSKKLRKLRKILIRSHSNTATRLKLFEEIEIPARRVGKKIRFFHPSREEEDGEE